MKTDNNWYEKRKEKRKPFFDIITAVALVEMQWNRNSTTDKKTQKKPVQTKIYVI